MHRSGIKISSCQSKIAVIRRDDLFPILLFQSEPARNLGREMTTRVMLFLMFLVGCGQTYGQSREGADPEVLQKLSNEFWSWRARYRPFTGADVPRIERPGGVRDWSQAAIQKQRADLGNFESRWKQLDVTGWSIPQRVDYRLIGSALARVRWELDVNPRWKRDPTFYIEQTLTPIVEALVVPGPYDARRSREILTRVENIPAILQQGETNLVNPPQPFASVAVTALENIRARLQQMAAALLKSKVTTLKEPELNSATAHAADALEHFRNRLQERLSSLPKQTALGRDAYVFFLQNVALIPYSPEQLLAMGRQEWH